MFCHFNNTPVAFFRWYPKEVMRMLNIEPFVLLSTTAKSKNVKPRLSKKVKPISSSNNAKNSHLFKSFSPDLSLYSSIIGTNPAAKANVEYILNLYEYEIYAGLSDMPSAITDIEMRDLLAVYPNEKELRRMLHFFYKRECARLGTHRRKAFKQSIIAEEKSVRFAAKERSGWEIGIFDPKGELVYGLWHNTLHARVPKQATRDYRHRHLLRQAAMFGQKLIIDFDYDQYMAPYEIRLLSTQIGILYYENRVNRDFPEALPFDIHFTNCAKAEASLAALDKHIKRMDQLKPYFHAKSYIDLPQLFPRNRLVYLSPHAADPLINYSHDDIYILGAYNDRSTHMKVSNAKAQSEGIRCYRLPLTENSIWRQGSRNLCLNQCSAILQAVKATDNWRDAIQRFAPQRKLMGDQEMSLVDDIRSEKRVHRERFRKFDT